ncbi:helix-turn-helix transcriptional regulator [Streptomyces sp. SAI-090]|uniref:helix-turn-helix domain-containing protein n=1 Tax=Streptomyces sp. SAI-090 TaxID=2940545 RepID=UPI002476AC27|nr:helix-turn-helix transcriptional regulator [Streptomyces sp. SAI-090]
MSHEYEQIVGAGSVPASTLTPQGRPGKGGDTDDVTVAEPGRGKHLRRYRQQKGDRPVASVAGLCGITPRYLHMIEEGKKVPSLEVLERIAAVLGVAPAALLAGEPISQPSLPGSAAPAVVRALLIPTRGPCGTWDAARLRERVERAWHSWQTSRPLHPCCPLLAGPDHGRGRRCTPPPKRPRCSGAARGTASGR